MKKRSLVFTVLVTILITSLVTIGAQQFGLVINGRNVSTDMIVKDGVTYLPLKTISNELGLDLQFKDGTIYLNTISGSGLTPPTTTPSKPPAVAEKFPTISNGKYSFTINSAKKATSRGKNVLIVDIAFKNSSGETTSPLGTLFTVQGFQNGVEIETTYDSSIVQQDNFTSVRSGSTLNYKAIFVLKNNSPVTVEISEFLGNKTISKTFN